MNNNRVDEVGWVYVIGNKDMPGIFKIGMTERDPEERLKEANKQDTWRPPSPYEIIIAKLVSGHKKKEKIIHRLLSKHRINPKREFFKISLEEIQDYFELMDGEIWINDVTRTELEPNIESDAEQHQPNRNVDDVFTNNQRIRHIINIPNEGPSIIEGSYDSLSKKIIYNEEKLSLNQFVTNHYRERYPRRTTANAWRECECYIDDQWKSTYDLPVIS
ncbi:MAG: hypothetical protein CMH79_04880 [Nitrospinae bacterium]|nr:hypothetical protein [Nitrospinota bacterium]|tara:strand:- start:3673 stop:4326 length:654 start_codon:yes stop_codon:yes gene_type:complete